MPDFAPQLSVKFRESASLQCGRGYIHTTSAAQSTLPGPQSAPLPLTKNANYMPAICADISDADTTVQKTVAAVQSKPTMHESYCIQFSHSDLVRLINLCTIIAVVKAQKFKLQT